MKLELTDEETFWLLNLLVDTIEADRYPMSPRIRLLRAIVRKFGEVGGLSNDLPQKLRRSARLKIGCECPQTTCAVTRRRFSSGCKAHPATAPAGSTRSRHGGDEMSEAFG